MGVFGEPFDEKEGLNALGLGSDLGESKIFINYVCLEYLNKGILIYLLYMDDWSTILVMYMALANFCLLASVVNKYNMKVP